MDNYQYPYKARPAILYKDAGNDATFLPITSNQTKEGLKDLNANKFQVEIYLRKHGLVKVNQPINISEKAIVESKNFNFPIPMNIRRKIIVAWNKLTTWSLEK